MKKYRQSVVIYIQESLDSCRIAEKHSIFPSNSFNTIKSTFFSSNKFVEFAKKNDCNFKDRSLHFSEKQYAACHFKTKK